MKIFSTVLLVVIAFTAQAEQFGRMHFSMPEESLFKFKKEDNGLYIQFYGNAIIPGKIAVIRYSDKKAGLYLIPNKSHINKMPFKILGNKRYLPTQIQLLNSNNTASEIINKNKLAFESGKMLIVGEGTVIMTDFNIGGDCSTPAFFTFKNKLQKLIIYSEKIAKNEPSC
jgi:hypothetical protein